MTETQHYDVLIIGAGINGAGLFRDLCEQGLRCLIVDKGDYGSGTSAAPSRLIHGGLKYLETGEFRLVAESTYERNLLLRNAPHLVTPLPTIIPIYSWTKGIWPAIRTFFGSKTAPRNRGAILVKIGLRLYDFYGARARQMPMHKMLSRRRALAEIPALTPDIVAVGTYHDAAISAPERLVLELVQDGIAASPQSRAMNWTDLVGQRDGVVQLTGPDGAPLSVRADMVVNAAGPWIDTVNARLGMETALIGGTKGSHILIDHPELLRQLNGRMIYFESDDGRILLVFPFLGKALVGSTDLPDDNPDAAHCTDTETDYFLHSLKTLLPGLEFGRDQIVFSYAGIRPLPNSAGIAPGLISRDHSAPLAPAADGRPFPIVSLIGGKWTTYRAFAADVADTILEHLGKVRHIKTDALPIGGGRNMPRTTAERTAWVADLAQQSGADPERISDLLHRYGTTAKKIALAENGRPDYIATTRFSAAEITWIAQNEQVHHLEDIVLRRTPLAITGQMTTPVLQEICQITARALGWNDARADAELTRARATLAQRHGITV
ncbi:glycerol-3-phosphate dehydrogenase/oxidase [Oceaniglobus ichthyenteri]|uniref:glycerol-3-phosphate dehydrogenase/oxidase n=1 Tax=Oceaniglobus ichthyenteri TaxID=2136177 RepID=UPI000D34F608|nr:glycerol-3-phosphate dehydrogenase/oxidase [Oceaniglobus ichthyenteri]